MRADAVRSPTRLDVGDNFALEPGQISVHSQYDKKQQCDFDEPDDRSGVLG